MKLLLERVAIHKPNIKYILSLVYKDNEKMNSISRKKYEFNGTVVLNNSILNEYKIEVPVFSTLDDNDIFLDKQPSKNTFLIKSKYIDMENARQSFLKRGNWVEYDVNSKKQPDFLYVDSSYIQDARLWKYKPLIKNMVNDDKYSIAYKHNLYTNMIKLKEAKPYLLQQENIDLIKYQKLDGLSKFKSFFKKYEVCIFKPVGGFSGQGIKIFNNYDDFYNHCIKIIEKNKHRWNNFKGNEKFKVITKREWILQEYINKPLLFEGKKFHLRVFFLYYKKYDNTLKKVVKKGYIFEDIPILTALKKYKESDYFDNKTHDTRYKYVKTPVYFTRDFKKKYGKKNTNKALKDLKIIFKNVLKCIDADCYSESKHCFELFGADIILDADFNMKLIEVNTKVGYNYNYFSGHPDNIDIDKTMMENLLETVIDDIIPPQNPTKKLENFIEI